MNKKNLFVFGGSKGIGSVFTRELSKKGKYNVTLFARTNPNSIAVEFYSVDFCHQDSFLKVLEEVAKIKGKIDHMVFFLKFRGNKFMDSWEGEIRVELDTIKNVMEILDVYLSDDSSIVFVSSLCGSLISLNQSIGYHMAKAGLEQMARYYAVKLGFRGIRVNVVAPTLTLKPENEEFYNQETELTALYSRISPLGRIAKSEDVCEVINFLLDVKFMTGQILRVDGGISLQEYESLFRDVVEEYLNRNLQKKQCGALNYSVSGGGGRIKP
ncbi:SDR family NAD(P)-dependent oxidoreductase [Helicobacter canadensis]|uniref:SDR family NAD(P)-dependent oxidoreductase n=1 Tax=Helicobacter canadensis TaxID=123841 RepID=UPI00019799FB|nr:SDR family oxidoreductase [Helicobacter canadensis]EFR48144.1 oxidoreductase, short chain dehydrogenase/reductase family protein [Helicobacter canadensis MIT 98-5491]